MYHRVLPKGKAEGVQEGMYVEQETFEAHLKFLKKDFNILPISEAPHNFKKKSSTLIGKPPCILTFDDGWHDFYKYAFSILKTYQISATVFLPTDYIGTNKWFWTDRLAKILIKKQSAKSIWHGVKRGEQSDESKNGNSIINQLENLKGPLGSKIEKAIQMLKKYRDEEINNILSELSRKWNVNLEPLGRSFVSWDEVREMGQSGLITFGSHSASHRILTTLTDHEIRDELMRSRERLIDEKVVDPSFIPFSYPNGNYNENLVAMVKEAGYDLAVTTEKGWNRLGSNAFTLRRIGIHQDMTSTEAMFGCRILGLF